MVTVPTGSIEYNVPQAPFLSRFRMPPQGAQGDYAQPMTAAWSDAHPRHVNISNQNTGSTFGVIQALYVNNVQCAVDVQFLFPDTDFQLDVPAGGEGIFPVVSMSNSFYVVATGAGAADITRFTAFNYLPPPFAIQKPAFQNVASVAGITLANGSTAILGAGVTGTLEDLSILFSGGTAGAGNSVASLSLVDGLGVTIASVTLAANGAVNVNAAELLSASGMNVRFHAGLNLVVANSGANPFALGQVSVNAYYH